MIEGLNDTDRAALVQYRLERAHETLDDAKVLFNNERYIAAANRLYYASFYAVEAILLNAKIQPGTHAGVKRMFGLHFISKGVFNEQWGKWFSDMCNMREVGDYDDFVYYSKADIEPIIPEVEEFIAMLTAFVHADVK